MLQAQQIGEIDTDEDPGLIVDEILAVVESLSVEAIINPDRMTAEHQMLLVERFLDRVATTSG